MPIMGTKTPVMLTGTFGASAGYVVLESYSPPFSVSVYPGSGCTVTVKSCAKFNAQSTADAGDWEEWIQGAVTTPTTYLFTGPVGTLQFTRSAGSVDSTYVVRCS